MDKLRTRCSLLMTKTAALLLLTLLTCIVLSCSQSDKNRICDLPDSAAAFWGDSAAIFIARNPQNGYSISIIHNKELTLAHFKRGDSISRYLSIDELPFECRTYQDNPGVYSLDIDFPIIKVDTLNDKCPPMFFMDMNFDNQEEFVQSFTGNGWIVFSCFDLSKGATIDFNPIQDPPYDYMPSGISPYQSGYTIFDYQNREIYITYASGCCTRYNLWAKYFDGDHLGHQSCVKVVKKECHDFYSGYEKIETYELKDNELKLTSITKQE